MPDENSISTNPRAPMIYRIVLEGHLGPEWADWFNGITVNLREDGRTELICPPVDQAALYGVLKKVRDLGMVLISVLRIESGRPVAADSPS